MSTPITADLVYQLKGVSDPAISPDGSLLAYTVSRVNVSEGNAEGRSRIMLMRLSDGSANEFTQGDHDSLARFSPDGHALAFLRPDPQGVKQVWLMHLNGGEAKKVTDLKSGVTDFAWSPDSRRLALCSRVDPDAPAGEDDTLPRVKVVQRLRYRFDTTGWLGDSHIHLFVVDLAAGGMAQLTDGDWDDTAPVWSPDGSRIAFVSGRRDDRETRDFAEAYVVSAQGGDPECWSEGLTSVGAVGWSPDGRQLAAIGTEHPLGMVLWQAYLYTLEPGRPPRRHTSDSIRAYLALPQLSHAMDVRWTQDDHILFLGDTRGQTYLYRVHLGEGVVIPVAGGERQSTAVAFDAGANAAVTVSTRVDSPGDLYYIDLREGIERRLTGENDDYLRGHPPGRMEKFMVTRGGFDIECRLLFPPGFDPARTYPLVLEIHGGPNGAFYDAFQPVHQVLATNGYLVLAVNPRGSSTYGEEFMLEVLEDWGGEDFHDQMAALDEVLSRSYVDSNRLGVHGYSYGGYMSSWIVGHTDRFKAAVVGAPCIDLNSMYGTSDIGVTFGEPQWGGFLGQTPEKLRERSPITYAANVHTPVLLLHGEADYRCPISQSEEYFTVLKRLGKDVEFVRFPDCSHLFLRTGLPKMREEYLKRVLGWFNRYLGRHS